MYSSFAVELALAQHARERECALRQAALLREARAAAAGRSVARRAAATIAMLAARLALPFGAPAPRPGAPPLRLARPNHPPVAPNGRGGQERAA